jgi:D-tyrosyl-tRNA(Tyr) deacylase
VIGLLQRVLEASVDIGAERVASIGPGLLVLVGVRPADDEVSALRLLDRLLQYRVFGDDDGKMNLSLGQSGGDLLLVPQFTLAADTHKTRLFDRGSSRSGAPIVRYFGAGGPGAPRARRNRRFRSAYAGIADQ